MRLEFRRLDLKRVDWDELDRFGDRTMFQTRPWLEFVSRTQGADPVVASIEAHDRRVGYFTGLIVRKYGLKMLGSPLPGWTTSYMGFNLEQGVSRVHALQGLRRFAFGPLGCIHFEVMDRRLSAADVQSPGFKYRDSPGFEVDLNRSEDDIFEGMTRDCRRCVRKAEREGVTIEEATDLAFADDYHAQLREVFARQRLVPTYGADRVRALIASLHPRGMLLLLRARDQSGACIATGLFPAFNDTVYFWGGASWKATQVHRPNELMHWYVMRYWKARGAVRYDMGGGGEHKRRYGGCDIHVPLFRASRYESLSILRTAAQRWTRLRQRAAGYVAARQAPAL